MSTETAFIHSIYISNKNVSGLDNNLSLLLFIPCCCHWHRRQLCRAGQLLGNGDQLQPGGGVGRYADDITERKREDKSSREKNIDVADTVGK